MPTPFSHHGHRTDPGMTMGSGIFCFGGTTIIYHTVSRVNRSSITWSLFSEDKRFCVCQSYKPVETPETATDLSLVASCKVKGPRRPFKLSACNVAIARVALGRLRRKKNKSWGHSHTVLASNRVAAAAAVTLVFSLKLKPCFFRLRSNCFLISPSCSMQATECQAVLSNRLINSHHSC